MLIPGIVGGIGPESTIDYYRKILSGFQSRCPGAPAPQMLINSISAQTLLALAASGDRTALARYLLPTLATLSTAGADFAVFASNTPHLVFDLLRERSPLPLISIVETARAAAIARDLRRLGLFGTQYTMQSSLYPDAFTAAGLEIVRPSVDEQAVIHQRYMTELVPGRFSSETRQELMRIVHAMARRDRIDALILGGTELSLLFSAPEEAPIPLLDTSAVHVDAILQHMLD